MMASGPAVKTGFWTNYEEDGGWYFLLTISNILGTILKILLGVIFGISWPWARAILVRGLYWSARSWNYYRHGSASNGSETRRLLSQVPPGYGTESVQSDNGTGRQNATWWKQLRKPNITRADLILAGIIALAAISYAVAGGAVGEIPANTLGRTNTIKSACGPWDLKPDFDRRVRDYDKKYMAGMEVRAANYGRDCYGSHSVYTPGRCDFFETSQIEYTVEPIHCPFDCTKDRCICARGRFETARRLSTGSFSAEKLGLNGKNLPFIRRTSTFVPLDIDYGFVVEVGKRVYEYYLGPVNGRNYTFDTWGDPFNWDIAAYSVSVYESTPFPAHDAWHPIEELERSKDSYMTAIFISPCRIAYDGRCEDPVFLAPDDLSEIGLPNKFRRKDTRARVLIAIDEMEICRQKDTDCYPPSEMFPEFSIEYEFVRTALRRTSTFQSIKSRLGEALVASQSLSDFFSPQLDKDQWVIESQGLFNTSLARLQFNMLDMATGNHPTGAAAGGFESAYENSTPDWAKAKMEHMCEKYKFHMSGSYTNIRVSYALALFFVPIVLFVLSRHTSKRLPVDDANPAQNDESQNDESQNEESQNAELQTEESEKGRRYMVFDIIIWGVWQGAKWVYTKLETIVSWVKKCANWVTDKFRGTTYEDLESPPREPESSASGTRRAEPQGTEPQGTEPQGTEPQGIEPQGTEPQGTESHEDPPAQA